MQCCESLNDTRSWAHQLRNDAGQQLGGWLASKVGDGCLRKPIDVQSHRLERYGSKLTLYSYRNMTHASDGLNAFSGILESLGRMYTEGFYCGLPLEDFQWGLLWASQSPPVRRSGVRFPSWSWAGWQVGIWAQYPGDFTKPHEYPIPLVVHRAKNNSLVKLFKASSQLAEFPDDPITKIAKADSESSTRFSLELHPLAERDSYLFMDVVVLQFAPDYTIPWRECIKQHGTWGYFFYWIGLTNCLIKIISTDLELVESRSSGQQTFLLLARDVHDGLVYHHLLQVVTNGNVVQRKTVLDLIIPEDSLRVLWHLRPRKTSLVLA